MGEWSNYFNDTDNGSGASTESQTSWGKALATQSTLPDWAIGKGNASNNDSIFTAAKEGLLANAGGFVSDTSKALSNFAKPSYMSDEEWEAAKGKNISWQEVLGFSKPENTITQSVQKFGENLEAAHQKNYEPYSKDWWAYNTAGILPAAGGLAAASGLALRSGNPQAIGRSAEGLASRLGAGAKLSKYAGELAPAATVGVAATVPEAAIEGQNAYDDAIQAGHTQQEAEQIRNTVTQANMALLGLTNTAEIFSVFGKLPFKVPDSTLKRFAARAARVGGMAAPEAIEEGAQQIIQDKSADRPVDWGATQQAAALGAVGGLMFGGAGKLANKYLEKKNNSNSGWQEALDEPPKTENFNEEQPNTPEYSANPLMAEAGDYAPLIEAASKKYDVPAPLIAAVMKNESSFDPNAASDAGAVGLMQLMPETATGLGVQDRTNPEESIDGGTRYLRALLNTFDGDVEKAVAAYNAGPQAVKDHGGIPPYKETQNYVRKVLGDYGSGQSTASLPEADLEVAPGVEDYNGVKDGVKRGARQMGAWLEQSFGITPSITSGRRSEENNASVNGAKNSWHLSGDAVDLDVGELTPEQQEAIRNKALQLGFREVLYHDAGSGLHLHLANLDESKNNGTGLRGYNGATMAKQALQNIDQQDQALKEKQRQQLGQGGPVDFSGTYPAQSIPEFLQRQADLSADENQINEINQALDNKNPEDMAKLAAKYGFIQNSVAQKNNIEPAPIEQVLPETKSQDPDKLQQQQALLEALNNVNAQKFDQAAEDSHNIALQKWANEQNQLQARKNEIAGSVLMNPVDRMEVGADLPQKTKLGGPGVVLGEKQISPGNISLPGTEVNRAALQEIESLKEKYKQPVTPLPNAEKANLIRRMANASRAGDYATAANLASRLEDTRRAELFKNVVHQNNPRERMTGEQIKQSVNYGKLDDMEKLFVDNLQYHNAPLETVVAEIKQERDNTIKDYADYIMREIDNQKPDKQVIRDSQGYPVKTVNVSMKWPFADEEAKRFGKKYWSQLTKQEKQQAATNLAQEQLRSGYKGVVPAEEIQHFKRLEDTIHGIERTKDRVSVALPKELREPQSGGSGRNQDIRGAVEHAKAIGAELGTASEPAGQRIAFSSEKINDEAIQTGQSRSFSFGQKPQAGTTIEIPIADGKVERIRFIPQKNWTGEEKAVSELGSFMGVPVQYFVGKKELRGFHDSKRGVTYINRNGNRGIDWTFWHENLHWMKQQDSVLYEDLLSHVQEAGDITQEQLAAYRNTIALGDKLSDSEVIEEMLSDEFADNAKRNAWLQQLQRRDMGLFDRVIDWLKATIAKIKYMANAGGNSHLTMEQVLAFENHAKKTLLSFRDKEGQRIFTDRTDFPYRSLPAEAVPRYSRGESDAVEKQSEQTSIQMQNLIAENTESNPTHSEGLPSDSKKFTARHHASKADLLHTSETGSGLTSTKEPKAEIPPNDSVDSMVQQGEKNANEFKENDSNNARNIVNEKQISYDLVKHHPEYKDNKEALSLAEKAIQLSLNFGEETRIDSAGGVFDSRRHADDGGRPGRRDSAVRSGKIIGLGVVPELIKKGVVSLIGKPVQSARDLAVTAQVLRHPGYETFHIVYVKKNSVVHHEAYSSRLPDQASFVTKSNSYADFIYHLDRVLGKTNADGYYFIHNHPSGLPQPSNADLQVTKAIANVQANQADNPINKGFKGHIVINSNKYALIDRNGEYGIHPLQFNEADTLLSPSIHHPSLGTQITTPSAIAQIAKSVQVSSKQSVIFYLTTQNEVRGVQVVPNDILMQRDNVVSRYLRWSARATFSTNAIVVTDSNEVFQKTKVLVEKGHLLDSYYSSKNLSTRRDEKVDPHNDRTWMGQKISDYGDRVLEDERRYSLGKTVDSATDKLAKNLGLKGEENVTIHKKQSEKNPNILDNSLRSVNRVARRFPKLQPFFRLANIAMEKQEDIRNQFNHRREKWEKVLGKDKAAKEQLYKALLQGDMEGRDYTNQELREMGHSEPIVKAYRMVRTAMDKAYKLANDTRQGNVTYSKNMNVRELRYLRNNKFAEILQERPGVNGDTLVTYKASKTYEQTSTVTQAELDALKVDDNVQVLEEKPLSTLEHALPGSIGMTRGSGFYEVTYREQRSPISKRGGYIPHFFHEWFVMEKATDSEGKEAYKMLGSGQTLRDATKQANEIARKNPNSEIVIQPKQFKFPNERVQAATIGDQQYFKMAQKVSDDLQINLADARKFLDGKVSTAGRHRFMGNFLQRKGAEGYEKNLDWVLGHYFNMVGRYAAMEPFKAQAITHFEKLFGRWDDDKHQGLARFTKDYINDINGVPPWIESVLNDALSQNPIFKKFLGKYMGDRPAVQLTSNITGYVACAKLGMLNVASAMLQTMQFLNVAAALNDYGAAYNGLRRAIRPSIADRIILRKSGVEANLTMESGSYSRAGMGKMLKNSTVLFHYLDMLMRQTAILGAYHQGLGKGMGKDEALQYAKKVNLETNFDYGVADAPNAFRRGGPVAQLLLQFKKFPIKQVEFMSDLLKEGDMGKNMRLWIPFLAVSGMFGVPFFELGNDFFDWLFGVNGKEKMKKAAFEWAGKDETKQAIVKAAIYGALSTPYTGGVDVSARTGMGDVMPTSLRDMAGPTIGTVISALRDAGQGNGIEAIKDVSPGLGNILQAAVGEAKTTRGRVRSTYDGYDRFVKLLGFRTTNEAVQSDVANIVKGDIEDKKDERKKAIDAFIKNPSSETMKQIRELGITSKMVQEEKNKKGKNNLDREMENVSKKQRSSYKTMQDFSK